MPDNYNVQGIKPSELCQCWNIIIGNETISSDLNRVYLFFQTNQYFGLKSRGIGGTIFTLRSGGKLPKIGSKGGFWQQQE